MAHTAIPTTSIITNLTGRGATPGMGTVTTVTVTIMSMGMGMAMQATATPPR